MVGNTTSDDPTRDDLAGIVPRAVSDVFAHVEAATARGTQCSVSVSFSELYGSELRDLLDPVPGKAVSVREDASGTVIVQGLASKPVASVKQVLDLLRQGFRARATSATGLNACSSRSHAVFTLKLVQTTAAGTEDAAAGAGTGAGTGAGAVAATCCTSELHLVDLAGSERQKKTGAEGDRLKEATAINQGLLALGNVIAALTSGNPVAHVPYRDSKLTRLLQNSLGGNACTVMLACVSPADVHFCETLCTLRYAQRASRITNHASRNEEADPQAALVARLRMENRRLQTALMQARGLAGTTAVPDGVEPVRVHAVSAATDASPAALLSALHQLAAVEASNATLRSDLAAVRRQLAGAQVRVAEAETQRDEWRWRYEQSAAGEAPSSTDASSTSAPPPLVAEQAASIRDLRKQLADLSQAFGVPASGAAERAAAADGGGGNDDTDEDSEGAALLRRVAELNDQVKFKEQQLQAGEASAGTFLSLKQQYEGVTQQLEDQVAALQEESQSLAERLRQERTRTKAAGGTTSHTATKLKERLTVLQAEIVQLKDKQREAARHAVLRRKAERRAEQLAADIAAAKAARADLLRKLKQREAKHRVETKEKRNALLSAQKEAAKNKLMHQRADARASKQAMVLQRRNEQLAAMKKELGRNNARSAYASERREARDASRKAREDALRERRLAAAAGVRPSPSAGASAGANSGAGPGAGAGAGATVSATASGSTFSAPKKPAVPPPAPSAPRTAAPAVLLSASKPTLASGKDTAFVDTEPGVNAASLDAATSNAAAYAVPSEAREALLEEMTTRANIRRAKTMMAEQMEARRLLSQEVAAYVDVGASASDLQPLKDRIAAATAKVSMLQQVLGKLDADQKARSKLLKTKWGTALKAAGDARRAVWWLATSAVALCTEVSAAQQQLDAHVAQAAVKAAAWRDRMMAMADGRRQLEQEVLQLQSDHHEQLQFVLANAGDDAAMADVANVLQQRMDVVERVARGREELIQEIEALRVERERAEQRARDAKARGASASKSSAKPKPKREPSVVYISDDDEDDDDVFDGDNDGSSSEDEWLPPGEAKKRSKPAKVAKSRTSTSSVSSTASGSDVKATTCGEEAKSGTDAKAGCECGGKCIRGCACKQAGGKCGPHCGCDARKCTNQAVAADGAPAADAREGQGADKVDADPRNAVAAAPAVAPRRALGTLSEAASNTGSAARRAPLSSADPENRRPSHKLFTPKPAAAVDTHSTSRMML